MSAELRPLRGRVAAQERLATALSARIEELAEVQADVEKHVDVRFDEIAATMAKKDDVEVLSESVDQRFTHVYGLLADIKADTSEIRNILATIVQRLEKP